VCLRGQDSFDSYRMCERLENLACHNLAPIRRDVDAVYVFDGC
jgi:hypothetical protein